MEISEITSAFTFWRKRLFQICSSIIEQTKKQTKYLLIKSLLLQRHIDLDEDEHGPLAHEMIIGLCKNDSKKWEEVANISKKALKEEYNSGILSIIVSNTKMNPLIN